MRKILACFSYPPSYQYMRHLPPTPDKGKFAISVIGGLIDSYRRTLELTEIEERLQALEEILYGYYKMMDYQPKNYAF